MPSVIFVLLVVLLLAAAACGGDEEDAAAPTGVTGTEPAPTETETAPAETEAPEDLPGDPQSGQEVFASAGCGTCHTFAPAESTGEIGPSLDDLEQRAPEIDQPLPEYVRESIVDPDAVVVEGFASGVMPDLSDELTEDQVEDLVAFLLETGEG